MASLSIRISLALVIAVSGCGDDRDAPKPASLRVPVAAARTAAPPVLPKGPFVWTHAQSARAAWYGPADAPALLAIACEGSDKRAARLVIVRYARADKGAEALFAIQGSKGILRLPVSAVKIGKLGYAWRGELDAGDPRAEVLLGNGLKATVPGGGQLDLPPMGSAGALVSECAAAAAQTLPNRASNPATSPAAR